MYLRVRQSQLSLFILLKSSWHSTLCKTEQMQWTLTPSVSEEFFIVLILISERFCYPSFFLFVKEGLCFCLQICVCNARLGLPKIFIFCQKNTALPSWVFMGVCELKMINFKIFWLLAFRVHGIQIDRLGLTVSTQKSVLKICTEFRDISQNVSNFSCLVWKAAFRHFFGNILGLGAYFKNRFLHWKI